MARRFPRRSCLAVWVFVGLMAFTIQPVRADLEYTFTGTVVDVETNPISSVRIWCVQDRQVQSTQSDENGHFRLNRVQAGHTEIVAYHPDWAFGGVAGYALDSEDVTIVLARSDAIELTLIDNQGERIPGAYLRSLTINDLFHVPAADLIAHGLPPMRSDREGILRIDHVPKNSYVKFTISHLDYADTGIPMLPAGSELSLPMPDGGKLRGRVTDGDGRGIAGARISLFRASEQRQFKFAESVSGPEGFYTAIARPAPYFVAVRHPDYAIPLPKPVVLGETGAVLDFTLLPPAYVRGRAVDQDGKPVATVKIEHVVNGTVYNAVLSDTDGLFEIVVPRMEGHLRVSPPPRMTTQAFPLIPFDTQGEERIRLEPIVLEPLPTITGTIHVPEGVRRDKVIVETLDTDPTLYAVTDEEGRFRLDLNRMPAAKKLRLRAEHALRFLRQEVEVDLGETVPIHIELNDYQPETDPAQPDWTPNDLGHMAGQPAPELACDEWFNVPAANDGEGAESYRLSELRGSVVVLNLWGAFNNVNPIQDTISELNALQQVYSDVDDVVILSVHDAALEPADIAAAVQELGITYPVCCDMEPAITFDNYNTNVIPQTVVIDKDGILQYWIVEDRLLDLIKDLRRRN